jgi:hypothetical protein
MQMGRVMQVAVCCTSQKQQHKHAQREDLLCHPKRLLAHREKPSQFILDVGSSLSASIA